MKNHEMKRWLVGWATSVAGVAMLAGSATAQDRFDAMTRDLTDMQKPIFDIRPETPGPLSVGVEVDRLDRTYAIGEAVSISVKVSKTSYVTIMSVDANGTTTILFPNALSTANLVRAGQSLTLPGPMAKWALHAQGPAGIQVIKVMASTSPTPVFSLEQTREVGPFRALNESLDSVARDLPTVLDSDKTTQWAEATRLIRIFQPH